MRRRAFLLLLALLAGCAGTVPVPLPSATRSYSEAMTISGRLSVAYERDGRAQSLQGKFRWAQSRNRTDIELSSPLGQTMARITILPDRAMLEQSNGEVRAADSVDALTEDALGWSLPVNGLRFWLQGFTRDGEQPMRAVAPGDTATLHSDGWRVRYVSWQDGGGVAVPKRIDFTRDETDQRLTAPLTLRIVIDDWNNGS